jgi:hypothetical protein
LQIKGWIGIGVEDVSGKPAGTPVSCEVTKIF